ncbi:unnamed protein product [Pedinophyceae sp. YPF-701]|nr:unnamed protein product [Pedinophyceae sp. YPF-701]
MNRVHPDSEAGSQSASRPASPASARRALAPTKSELPPDVAASLGIDGLDEEPPAKADSMRDVPFSGATDDAAGDRDGGGQRSGDGGAIEGASTDESRPLLEGQGGTSDGAKEPESKPTGDVGEDSAGPNGPAAGPPVDGGESSNEYLDENSALRGQLESVLSLDPSAIQSRAAGSEAGSSARELEKGRSETTKNAIVPEKDDAEASPATMLDDDAVPEGDERDKALFRSCLFGINDDVFELLKEGANPNRFWIVEDVIESQQIPSISPMTRHGFLQRPLTALYAAAWQKQDKVLESFKRARQTGVGVPADPMCCAPPGHASMYLFHYATLDCDIYWKDSSRVKDAIMASNELANMLADGEGKSPLTVNTLSEGGGDEWQGVSAVHLAFDYIKDFESFAASKYAVLRALTSIGGDFTVPAAEGGTGGRPMDWLVRAAPDVAFEIAPEQMTKEDRAAASKALADTDVRADLLIRRAALGDAVLVKRLVESDASPNDFNDDGVTALYAAAQQKHSNVINTLGTLRAASTNTAADPLITSEASLNCSLFHFLVMDASAFPVERVVECLEMAHKFFGAVRSKEYWGDPRNNIRLRAINAADAEGKTAVQHLLEDWSESLIDTKSAIDLLRVMVRLGADLTLRDSSGSGVLHHIMDMGPELYKELVLDRMVRRRAATPIDMVAQGITSGTHAAYVNLRFGWWDNGGSAEASATVDQKFFAQDADLLTPIEATPDAHFLLKHPVVQQQVDALWSGGFRREAVKETALVSIFVVLVTLSSTMAVIFGVYSYKDLTGLARLAVDVATLSMNMWFLWGELMELMESTQELRGEGQSQILTPAVDLIFARIQDDGYVNREKATSMAIAEELGLDLEPSHIDKEFGARLVAQQLEAQEAPLSPKVKTMTRTLSCTEGTAAATRVFPPESIDRASFHKMWAKLTNRATGHGPPPRFLLWFYAIKAYTSSVFNLNDIALHIIVPVMYGMRALHYFTEHSDEDPISSHLHDMDIIFMCASSVLAWGKMARFFLTYQPLGPLVVMVFTMLRRDIARFLAILLLFFFGFVTAFYVLLRHSEDTEDFSTYPKACLASFFMLLDGVSDYIEALTSASSYMGPALGILYAVMGQVLLLNLLIAMMATSYEEVSEKAEVEYSYQVVKNILATASKKPGLQVPMRQYQNRVMKARDYEALEKNMRDADPIEDLMALVLELRGDLRRGLGQVNTRVDNVQKDVLSVEKHVTSMRPLTDKLEHVAKDVAHLSERRRLREAARAIAAGARPRPPPLPPGGLPPLRAPPGPGAL